MNLNLRKQRLVLLESRVERESLKEFGSWEDGTPWIEATLVDRQTHEGLHFISLPYWHKATEEQQDEILRLAMVNLSIAFEAMRLTWDLIDYRNRSKKKKQ